MPQPILFFLQDVRYPRGVGPLVPNVRSVDQVVQPPAQALGTGSAAGIASVGGVGAALVRTTGSAAAAAAIAGAGAARAVGLGAVTAAANVSGTSLLGLQGIGTASGSASVAGSGLVIAYATGAATGFAAVLGVGAWIAPAQRNTALPPRGQGNDQRPGMEVTFRPDQQGMTRPGTGYGARPANKSGGRRWG